MKKYIGVWITEVLLYHCLSNCPDIVVFDCSKQLMLFIKVSCPADINVPSKEWKKLHKYHPLAMNFHLMYIYDA